MLPLVFSAIGFAATGCASVAGHLRRSTPPVTTVVYHFSRTGPRDSSSITVVSGGERRTLPLPATAKMPGTFSGNDSVLIWIERAPLQDPPVPPGTYVRPPFRFSEPLIVVDSVSAPTWPMDTAFTIPRRLLAIQLIRGAAAATYYGSRAAGGVIEIQTRIR
jgi:hypothetical protein